mmetsp:Transcript_29496/g.47975  ORF Transcript_29496/g.47975 Transcript_29496/m.47975 type:complete len:97 (-) Transcript_29496:857-1147(-)
MGTSSAIITQCNTTYINTTTAACTFVEEIDAIQDLNKRLLAGSCVHLLAHQHHYDDNHPTFFTIIIINICSVHIHQLHVCSDGCQGGLFFSSVPIR